MSEFISFITSEASERCQNEKRKTINGEDILYAMVALGFDNYVEPLTLYLHKYREVFSNTPSVPIDLCLNIFHFECRRQKPTETSVGRRVHSKSHRQLISVSWLSLLGANCNSFIFCIDKNECSSFPIDQQNLRNGIVGSTVNNGAVTTTNGSNASAGSSGGVVLGQIGESILYYQNDQNQTFQLWWFRNTFTINTKKLELRTIK